MIETRKIIDDKSNVQTLLRVLQKEKEKKKQQKQEVLHNTNKSIIATQMYSKGLVSDLPSLIYGATISWLLFLVSNRFTGWFWTSRIYLL